MIHNPRNQKPRRGEPATDNPVDPHKISEQKQIEKVLARISDSFVALDTNWVYTYVNEKAAQTFGRTPEQLYLLLNIMTKAINNSFIIHPSARAKE